MLRLILACCLLGSLVLLVPPLKGQQKPDRLTPEDIAGSLNKALERLKPRARDFSLFEKDFPERVSQSEKDLYLVKRAIQGKEAPDDFLQMCKTDATLLASIDVERPSREGAEKAMIALEDLSIKATHLHQMPKDPYRVRAVVRTKNNMGTPVGQFEVWYVQRGLEADSKLHKQFATRSTPTAHTLSPGNWTMWTKSPNAGQSGIRKTVPVRDENSSGECQIDLPIP